MTSRLPATSRWLQPGYKAGLRLLLRNKTFPRCNQADSSETLEAYPA